MKRFLKRAAIGLLILGAAVAGLFAWNGLSTAWRTPDAGVTNHPAAIERPPALRVLAWNIAKGGAHFGGTTFRSPDSARAFLDRIAALIRDQRADIVFLSETMHECGPCPVDQPAYLAEAAGFHAWAFGANYRWGLPFYRIVNGIAVLSRFPLRPVETVQLEGERPFYDPKGNRRMLWVEIDLAGEPLTAASVWLDSGNSENRLVQARSVVDRLEGRPALLAGDFNCPPASPEMAVFRDSGLFVADFEAKDPSFPARGPEQRIDHVLGPRGWTHRSTVVVHDEELSDHRPVLAEFDLPAR